MADAPRVVSVGSILIDLTLDVQHVPERGGDVLATSPRTLVGGGFNLAVAVARQGGTCVYGSAHGVGPYGDLVRAGLAAEGIRSVFPPRPDGDTGFCVVLIEPDGERTFLTAQGVEAVLAPGELDALEVRGDDWVAVSGYDLAYPGSGAVVAAWVAGLPAGTSVALDPGPLVADIPSDRLAVVLRRTTLLTMNQREARLLTGSAAAGIALLAALLEVVAIAPTAVVVVREGAAGCVATGGALGAAVLHVPAAVVAVVDTTGAGDCHTGVLIAGLVARLPLPDALARASAAAAISVTRPGAAVAPTAAEIDAFLSEA